MNVERTLQLHLRAAETSLPHPLLQLRKPDFVCNTFLLAILPHLHTSSVSAFTDSKIHIMYYNSMLKLIFFVTAFTRSSFVFSICPWLRPGPLLHRNYSHFEDHDTKKLQQHSWSCTFLLRPTSEKPSIQPLLRHDYISVPLHNTLFLSFENIWALTWLCHCSQFRSARAIRFRQTNTMHCNSLYVYRGDHY